MPIVVVHGVNNREGSAYQAGVLARDEFLRALVAPALGLPESGLTIENPYWGSQGASFAWNMAVLPSAADDYQAFGRAAGADEADAEMLALLSSTVGQQDDITARARNDFAGTLDLVFAAAMAGVKTREEAAALAWSYRQAMAYALANPSPAWLAHVNDQNFASQLRHSMKAVAGSGVDGADGGAGEGEEAFGGSWWDTLKEGVSRLGHAVPDATSALVGALARKQLNAAVTRFSGDAFVYLASRNQHGVQAPIVQTVMQALRSAEAARTVQDARLVVLAHSFGGEIVYDILSSYWPELRVDCLVTVGSQVGLFEEMKLYAASLPTVSPKHPVKKVPRPANLARWLNVFDTNDVLSYRAEPVFDGVEDFHYDTGFSLFQAHGGYFERPSFYKRLAERLSP